MWRFGGLVLGGVWLFLILSLTALRQTPASESTHIIFQDGVGCLCRVDLEGESIRPILPFARAFTESILNIPESDWLIIVTDYALYKAHWRTGEYGLLHESPTEINRAVVSPDGVWLYFDEMDAQNYNNELYRVGLDGSDLTNLTQHEDYESEFQLSPDGAWLAFVSDRNHDFANELYLMRSDGSDLTMYSQGDKHHTAPVFSPDNHKLAFWTYEPSGTDFELWVMQLDGSGARSVWLSDSYKHFLAFSPDSQTLFFGLQENLGVIAFYHELYRVGIDGSDLRQLTFAAQNIGYPTYWLADEYIFYAADELRRMNLDGTQSLFITSGDRLGNILINGEWIVFVRYTQRTNIHDLYRIDLNGNHLKLLSEDVSPAFTPIFAPPLNLPWRVGWGGVIASFLLLVSLARICQKALHLLNYS